MNVTGRPFTNTELNNAMTVSDLIQISTQPPARGLVEKRKRLLKYELAEMDLPPNMHWIPSQRDLRNQLNQRQ